VAFGRTAEIIRDYVKKGSQLFVEGKITTRSWDDKESGQKKYRTEIIVNDMSLLGGRGGEGGQGGGNYERSSNSGSYGGSRSNTAPYGGGSTSSQPDYADQGITDEDIPF
jgi:single-strand DNA-binding protein